MSATDVPTGTGVARPDGSERDRSKRGSSERGSSERVRSERDGRIDIRRVIWLVTRREIVVRTRSKAFRITTALSILALAGFVLATKVSGAPSTPSVAFTTATATLGGPLQSAAAVGTQDVTESVVADQAEGERLLRDGDVDALVVGTPEAFRVVVAEELSETLTSTFSLMARQRALDEQIIRLGGDPAVVGGSVSSASLDVVALKPRKEYQEHRLVLGMVTGLLVYLSLLVFGPQVAQGVIEEKTSRVVELLLATVRPWQLMAGKVLGIAAVALGQLALVGAVGVVLGLATGVLDLPASVAIGAAAWALVWFLLGFAVYGLLFAAAGALVSRQEDAGGVTAPIMMMIIVPYVIGVSVLPGDPDSVLVTVLALIPLFSPLLMPMLIAIGGAAVWQVALALVLTVALLVVLVWLTGRVYGNAVTRSGTRVRLSEALRRT